jgi:hypothetical protein
VGFRAEEGSAFGFSPVVDGVSDGGGGQVAAAHFVFGNAAEEVMEQFDVTREQIAAVLDFVAQSLKTSVPPASPVDAHSL